MKMMLFLLTVVAFALTMTGCGGYSCEDACKKGNSCSGATQEDCAASCDKASKLNDKSGCGDKYDALLSCADDNQDKICDTNSTACSSEGIAYAACITTYCTANSSESVCHS